MSNRTRTIGANSKVLKQSCLYDSHYPGNVQGWVDGEVTDSHETICDVYEPYSRGAWRFKPCVHDKFEITWNEGSAYMHHRIGDGNSLRTIGIGGFGLWAISSIGTPLLEQESFLAPVGAFPDDAKRRLARLWVDTGRPRIKADLDLLVNLVEWTDIKDVFLKVLSGIRHAMHGLDALKSVAKGIKLTLSKDASSIKYKVSDAWLEYNFAWAPLLSDLIGFFNSLLTFKKQLRALRAGVGVIHRWHGGFSDSLDLGDKNGGGRCNRCSSCIFESDRDMLNYPWTVKYDLLNATKYGITVAYTYTLPNWVEGLEGDIRALFASLGVSPGLDTIWELIPFSFVLDWIYPLGSVLAQYELDPCPVKCTVIDVTISRNIGIHGELRAKFACGLDPLISACSFGRSYYERIVDPTVLSLMPTFRWPSLFQLSLGSALLTNLRKKKVSRGAQW